MKEDFENSFKDKDEKKKPKEVKLKSAMYNHDAEMIVKKEEKESDYILWGFVLGFLLFFIITIIIIISTR
jgi:type IV secretory pathway component VirB8